MKNLIIPVVAWSLIAVLTFTLIKSRNDSKKIRSLNIDEYMKSDGVAKFLNECTTKGFSKEFSLRFLKSLLMAGGFQEGIDPPNLSQDVFAHWGLDDDMHEIINRMDISGSTQLRWDDPKLDSIKTIYDLMMFSQKLTQK